MRNMRIGTRILLGFAMMVALGLCIGTPPRPGADEMNATSSSIRSRLRRSTIQ